MEQQATLDRRRATLLPALQNAIRINQVSQHKYLKKSYQFDVHPRVLPPISSEQRLALTVFLPSIYETLGYITAPLTTKTLTMNSRTAVSESDPAETLTDGREEHLHTQQAEPMNTHES